RQQRLQSATCALQPTLEACSLRIEGHRRSTLARARRRLRINAHLVPPSRRKDLRGIARTVEEGRIRHLRRTREVRWSHLPHRSHGRAHTKRPRSTRRLATWCTLLTSKTTRANA